MEAWYNVPVPLYPGITQPWEHPMTALVEDISKWCDKTLPRKHFKWHCLYGFTQDKDTEFWDRIYVMRICFYSKEAESMFLLKYSDNIAKTEIHF